MNKNILYYYENCDDLSISDIRNFIILLCEIEIRNLGVQTKINYQFRDDMSDEVGAAISDNFKKYTEGKLEFPLTTNGFTLQFNDKAIIDKYLDSKNKIVKISSKIEIPKALNVLSAVASLCSHEIRHAYQNEQIMNNKTDSIESILWLKSRILRNKFEQIYEENYESYYIEQDSYNYQYKLPFELLSKYSGMDKDTLDEYKQYLKESEIVLCKDKKLDATFKEMNSEFDNRIGTAYINELFNELIKDLPRDYISNSLLKYEYNSDGSKKTYVELINDNSISDSLRDFIIDCDYNLQVQKILTEIIDIDNSDLPLDIKNKMKEKKIKNLKLAYHRQDFNYKNIHSIIQKKINKILSELKKIYIKSVQKRIDDLEMIDINQKLFKQLEYYRKSEIILLKNIKDYEQQKEEDTLEIENYSKNIKLISDYRESLGIFDTIKNGMVIDNVNYNKLIANVIKSLNNPLITEKDKMYLLKVKRAIIEVYFPSMVESNEKTDKFKK